MNAAATAVRDYFRELIDGWNRFWFTAVDPAVLSAIRICAGLMLLYTHLVWTIDLEAFFGVDGWIARDVLAAEERAMAAQGSLPTMFWSHFWLIESRAVLWVAHIAALIVFALLTVGYRSRLMSVLAFLLAVSYVHRAQAAFFGLDKINCMLAMYLMIGPSGAYYSVDRWLARRRAGGQMPAAEPSICANVAIRMIQLHMCIIYLFSGIDKLQGPSWWNGTAVWQSVANLEYQSLDMTWLASWPMLVGLVTHVTVFWEVFYCVLIWPKLTRPVMLAMAVAVHGGIAIALGMPTFGLAMLIGNIAFLSPPVVRAVLDPILARDMATTGERRALAR